MARKPRFNLIGVPQHVIQRGNNRDVTFFAEQDYQFYLECFYDAASRYHVNIHAYVLMTNHVHLFNDATFKRVDKFSHAVNRSTICPIYQ